MIVVDTPVAVVVATPVSVVVIAVPSVVDNATVTFMLVLCKQNNRF